MAGAEIEYSEEERSALKGIFDLYDRDQIGEILSSDLGAILEKIGRSPEEAAEMLKESDPDMSGALTFEDFLMLLKKKDSETQALGEGPDPKVIEFLHILDEYRVKCEDEGNYLEAGRAAKQLETLKKQEAKRQEKALRARQLAERQDVQIAHNMQYAEFNAAWDKYLEEYDQMAHMYIQQMTERHAVTLREFQEDLHRQVSNCRVGIIRLLPVQGGGLSTYSDTVGVREWWTIAMNAEQQHTAIQITNNYKSHPKTDTFEFFICTFFPCFFCPGPTQHIHT